MANPLKSITFPGLEGEYEVLLPGEIQALVNNGKTKVDLLWQNASPDSTFAGDADYIDLGEGNTTSKYPYALILCRYSTGLGFVTTSNLLHGVLVANVHFPKGYFAGEATREFRRDGGQAGRYLYVSHGYLNGSESDSYCIPYQVYGIKW